MTRRRGQDRRSGRTSRKHAKLYEKPPVTTALEYPEGPMEKVGSVFVPTTQREVQKAIESAYSGECEVEGCTGKAVAYHAACMWRLCARHAGEHAKRTRE